MEKKKSKLLRIVLILLAAGCVFYGFKHQQKVRYDRAMDFYYGENGLFSVTEDDVTYYFKKNKHDETRFIRYELNVTPTCEREIIGNIASITVQQYPTDLDRVFVIMEDTVPSTYGNGKTYEFDEYIQFQCGTDFSEDSLTRTELFTDKTKCYYRITHWYISQEDLAKYYEKAMSLQESL